jgi:DNA polymerase-3 subunit beta
VYYHTILSIDTVEEKKGFVIEPRKCIEFIQLLQPGVVDIEFKENQCSITQGKTKGIFPIILTEDFPLPPALEEEKIVLQKKFLTENLPFILFTASTDDSRPVLTGINFVVSEDELIIVSTDGFRLSLLKEPQKGTFSNMIIPADFLQEVIKNVKNAKEVSFTHSSKEQIVLFTVGDEEYYSRLIDGEFPPFERVIPSEKKTTIELSREELLRNTKLISIFARDYSNVILYSFSKDGLTLMPKEEGNKENATTQDITFEGEPQQIAFNFKYVVDFLNHIKAETIVIEILRSDAPVVFKTKGNEAFLHIIMPVRIQS